MAWFGGVVYHFSWAIIHNIKPNHVDYYHIEGFWNCSMYVRNKYGVKIHTWVETPCRYGLPGHPFTPLILHVWNCNRQVPGSWVSYWNIVGMPIPFFSQQVEPQNVWGILMVPLCTTFWQISLLLGLGKNVEILEWSFKIMVLSSISIRCTTIITNTMEITENQLTDHPIKLFSFGVDLYDDQMVNSMK